jgi:lysozyme family protein
MDFDQAFGIVVGVEGGYSIDPNDPGNWTGGKVGVGMLKGTKFGISAASYPNVDIKNLTLNEAKQIYLEDFWQDSRCYLLMWPVSLCLFDGAVNQGPGTAHRLLQEAVKVSPDGIIGPVTIAACNKNPLETAAVFMALRARRYTQTSGWESNGKGWLSRLFRVVFAAG